MHQVEMLGIRNIDCQERMRGILLMFVILTAFATFIVAILAGIVKGGVQ